MINWFNMPDEGLSNGGLFEVKELEVTENGTYETKGEMYNKVTVNVEGGGGSSDFSTAEVTIATSSEIPVVVPFANDDYSWADGNMTVGTDGATITAILYKGMAAIWSPNSDVTSVSGNATLDDGTAYATGDCSITFE